MSASGRYFFDWSSFWRMVRLARTETSAARRRRSYATMAFVLFVAGVHAFFFALDPIVFPSLRRTSVRAPVFLVGHARSGTTYLHRELAKDPRFSTVLLWEMFFPSLIEKRLLRGLLALDRRMLGGRLHRRLAQAEDDRVGMARGVHDTGLFVPEEDDFLLATSCFSGFWIALFPYVAKLDFYHVDAMAPRRRRKLMAFYRECVRRQIHLNGEDKIHLSKNPAFCGRVEALLETFPDARLVVQVRHPYETIPSFLRMMKGIWRRTRRDDALVQESLRLLAEQSFHSYQHPLAVIDARPDVPAIVVEYRDLVGDPERTVEAVYDALELGLPPVAEARAPETHQPHAADHVYSLEEFGLSAGDIHTRLAPLFARFGWDASTTEKAHA